jgi:hypothetical protein
MVSVGNTDLSAGRRALPSRAARSARATRLARAIAAALALATLLGVTAANAAEDDSTQPGPTLPAQPTDPSAGPQLLAPETSGAPSVPTTPAAPFAEPGKSFEPAPPPTPDLTPMAPAGRIPVDDGYWIASSWHCRQMAPHGCACGDLDFYHVGMGGTQLLNRAAFAASLAPGVPVCIVVHGSFTNWKGLCDDCAPVLQWIRSAAPQQPLHVVFYTWPSQGGITYEPHVDVGILGMRASFNSIYLAELVARIPPGHPVCLLGHSHGARMVAAALHVLGGGEVDNVRLTWPAPPDLRLRGVLVAGALDHHWLDPGQRFDMALCRTECLLVLRNDHDIVLTFYPLRRPFSRRAIGERGLSGGDLRRLGLLSSKVAVLDVTSLVQTGHIWQHYYVCPQIAAAIAPYIYYFDSAPSLTAVPPPAPAVSDSLSLSRSAN